jgi:hypothetical protein
MVAVELLVSHRQSALTHSCGKEITDKAKIWWNGYTPEGSAALLDFALHAECAAKLAVHLRSDALKADLANDQHILNHGSPLTD